MFPTENTILCLVLEVTNLCVASSLGRFLYIKNMASKDALVEIPEEEEDQWVAAGPQNPKEARSYCEKVETIFEMFSELLANDKKMLSTRR